LRATIQKIARDDHGVRALRLQVGQNRFKGGQIGMDIGNNGKSHTGSGIGLPHLVYPIRPSFASY